jgi:hypothetical protein
MSSDLEEKCLDLKLEVKAWEYEFKEENGRPPSKDDIKHNAVIFNL